MNSVLNHAKQKVKGHYALGMKPSDTMARVGWLTTGNTFHYGGLDTKVCLLVAPSPTTY